MRDPIAQPAAVLRRHGPAIHAARIALIALGPLLGGCSSFSVEAPLVLTDPGRFQYHNCDQLNTSARDATIRAAQLKVLMAKADQGIAGPIVGTVAYRTDYLAANEELRLIEEAARAKNCVTTSTWQSNTAIQ